MNWQIEFIFSHRVALKPLTIVSLNLPFPYSSGNNILNTQYVKSAASKKLPLNHCYSSKVPKEFKKSPQGQRGYRSPEFKSSLELFQSPRSLKFPRRLGEPFMNDIETLSIALIANRLADYVKDCWVKVEQNLQNVSISRSNIAMLREERKQLVNIPSMHINKPWKTSELV